ncbi:MAG: ATP-dependent helicase HrpB [Bacteroidetes bacterium]|nr:MAG: ATP-dependent helicase HrpB [Bacteroidota bacterium]
MTTLPIGPAIPELVNALRTNRAAVLCAAPGAGKTTRVPLELLRAGTAGDRSIIMLEPRRIAAVRSAEYMALSLGESAGETVGYRIRGEKRTGRSTRIEVVTEGILTRMLQHDPSLDGAGLIIFDEFHERSIHADLGLAFVLDVCEHIRPDLKVLVMSATMDSAAVSRLLDGAPVVVSEGREYPVETIYRSLPRSGSVESECAAAVSEALRDREGDVLVFLPGQREIRRTEEELARRSVPPETDVHLLYGEAPPERQRAALSRTPGRRKVILATSVAETSVTIDGVRVVVDAGLARTSAFDPARGMSGLVTVNVSKASADQRRGRAGRQAPGICYRLWTEHEQSMLAPFTLPEIATADLTAFALEAAVWGDPELRTLKLLDAPPEKHFNAARDLLVRLGALDAEGRLTTHGRSLAGLGTHPRYAHMLTVAMEHGFGAAACDMAALLEERDAGGDANAFGDDLSERFLRWKRGNGSKPGADRRVTEQSAQYRTRLGLPAAERSTERDAENIGMCIALAYPDRIAKQRPGTERYQLSGNTVGVLQRGSTLARHPLLAVAEVDGAGAEVRILRAAPIERAQLDALYGERYVERSEMWWDERQECIVSRSVKRLWSIELERRDIEPDADRAAELLSEAVRRKGVGILPWDAGSLSLRSRSEWLRRNGFAEGDWRDVGDDALARSTDEWLLPFLTGIRRLSQLTRLDMAVILASLIGPAQKRTIERLAPTHIVVPTGSRIPVDYSSDPPVVAVRLQEMFGEERTPAVAGGKVSVVLHLLSPAHRPLAITQDLPSFWRNAYPGVRKDMRGQYPKHFWPEDPLTAPPTRRTKKAMDRS